MFSSRDLEAWGKLEKVENELGNPHSEQEWDTEHDHFEEKHWHCGCRWKDIIKLDSGNLSSSNWSPCSNHEEMFFPVIE